MLELRIDDELVDTVAPGSKVRLPDGRIVLAIQADSAIPGVTITEVVPPEPEPVPPTIADYQAAIDAHIEATALARNYGSAALSATLSIATYVASTNPVWAAEAAAFIAWRDQVWGYAYVELDQVQQSLRPQPSIAAFIDELPAIEWPE
jgi:hypothetical protein